MILCRARMLALMGLYVALRMIVGACYGRLTIAGFDRRH